MGRVRLAAVALIIVLAAAGAWTLAAAQTHTGHNHAAQAAPHENHAASAGDVCEICGKPMVAARSVTLRRAGDKAEHHLRCIHCALVAARDWYPGDVTLRTKSAEGGEPVTLTRTNGKWSASPSTAAVLMQPEAKGECIDQHLVFATAAKAKAYQQSHAATAREATFAATDVDGILLAGRGPLPKETTCPVSGQTVHPTASTKWTAYQGKVYYFCCPGCEPRFVANAEGYAAGTAPKMKMMEGGSCQGHEGAGEKGHQRAPSQHHPSSQST